jgi:hypothetical protein
MLLSCTLSSTYIASVPNVQNRNRKGICTFTNSKDKNIMRTFTEYVPGTCNIGPVEFRKRKNAMWFSLGLTLVTIALLIFLHAARPWRSVLFVPLSAFAVNFQQVYFGFCVNFGLRGIFNFGNEGAHDSVEQAEFRKKDRSKAIRMIGTGVLIGLVVTILFYCLPV